MVSLAKKCDAILLIDSPAFNLPLAKLLKEADVSAKITYYILPQVWAWKKNRIEKVKKYCDNLASILPFEKQFYTNASYVGHPLLDEIKFKKDLNKNLSNESLIKRANTISFMPGSRRAEISRLMPVFRQLAYGIKGKKLLIVPPKMLLNLEIYGDISDFEVRSDAPSALYESDFAFICSGTATLEATIIGTPFVLAYKARTIDIMIARMFVKLPFIGLANIIMHFLSKKSLHPELLQDEVTPKALLRAFEEFDEVKFKTGVGIVREYLAHGSSQNVAKILKNGEKND